MLYLDNIWKVMMFMSCNVRLLHANPDSTCLDFYINDNLLEDNCPYKYLSDYIYISITFFSDRCSYWDDLNSLLNKF